MIIRTLKSAATTVALAWLVAAAGCATARPAEPPAPALVETLRVTDHVGGTHEHLHITADAWYVTFNNSLLVLNPRSADQRAAVTLAPMGEAGPATDLLVSGDRAWIVLERDAVVELDLAEPRRPVVIDRVGADTLGIEPLYLSQVDGEVYISGEGGVVRYRDRAHLLDMPGVFTRVAPSARGLVAATGRRIHRLADGAYAGSASNLAAFDDPAVEPGTLAFVRQREDGAWVGLLTPELREVDTHAATKVVPGIVRHMRVFDGRIWVITDEWIHAFAPKDGGARLEPALMVRVRGARDVGRLAPNYLAIAGSFGRAIYRIQPDGGGPGDTFLYAHREPSRLSEAVTNGRAILAGSEAEGMWIYGIESGQARLSDETIDGDTEPLTQAKAVGFTATITPGGQAVTIETPQGTQEYREGPAVTLHTLAAVNGRLWIGHDRGITVLSIGGPAETAARSASSPATGSGAPATASPIVDIDRLRLHGPVRFLMPLRRGDGAAFVSEFGGFGAARYTAEDAGEGAA